MLKLCPDRCTLWATGSVAREYSVAVGSVAFCTSVALELGPISRHAPFVIFIPAVLATLCLCGFRAALFASVLSALAADFFVTLPLFHFHLRAADLFNESLFVAALGLASWVIDRHRMQINKANALQTRLLESAAEPILITDQNHKVVYWNGGATRLYGWTEAEAKGQKLSVLLRTVYAEPEADVTRQFSEDGHWRGQLTQKNKDGHEIIAESTWTMDRESGFTLKTELDVTARVRSAYRRKQMAAELKRVNRALTAIRTVSQALTHAEDEEPLWREVVNVIADQGGYPLAWIGAAELDERCSVKMLACAGVAAECLNTIKLTWKDEPCGRGPTGIALREGRDSVIGDLLLAPDCAPWSEQAAVWGIRSEVSLPLIIDGKTIAALSVFSAEVDVFKGEELHLLRELAADLAFGIAGIRNRKEIESQRQQRIQLEAQLQQAQKLEALGSLAGGIAHDFNNLLMVIMAQAELLTMKLEGPALERAESVIRSAKRGAELTGQLLAFSRKQATQPIVTSLNRVLTNTLEMTERLVPEDIEVRVVQCENPWLVKIDRLQFEQVIMNLVVNARDAMPDGGLLTIQTENCVLEDEYRESRPLVRAGKYAMLAISDNGTGMSLETQARLFEPFFTTKEPGKGTGLGLAMVYGIVKQAKGFIWAYSELGKGTCFKMYLPVESEAEQAEQPTALPAKVERAAKILLVEDDDSLREIICQFLESGGHTVISASCPQDAYAIALERKNEIEILLTDVVLKGGNGKQLAQRILDSGCKFTVIYMSGYTRDAIVHHGVLEPGLRFLQKPFSRAVLLNKINEALVS